MYRAALDVSPSELKYNWGVNGELAGKLHLSHLIVLNPGEEIDDAFTT